MGTLTSLPFMLHTQPTPDEPHLLPHPQFSPALAHGHLPQCAQIPNCASRTSPVLMFTYTNLPLHPLALFPPSGMTSQYLLATFPLLHRLFRRTHGEGYARRYQASIFPLVSRWRPLHHLG